MKTEPNHNQEIHLGSDAMKILRAFAEAYQKQNLNAVLSNFSEDAEVLTADGEQCRGAEELAARFRKEFLKKEAREIVPLSLSVKRHEAGVEVRSRYEMTETERGAKSARRLVGEFNAVVQKPGSEWRITRAQFRML
jgi:ketosteroid isomerase-like protein